MLRSGPSHSWLAYDELLCLRLNRGARICWVRSLFRLVSRLGNGVFWYVLMLWLLLSRQDQAPLVVLHMAATGLGCTALYKWLKTRTCRPRPYQVNRAISCDAVPLDHFSFPSGHTLHAVAFSTVLLAYDPGFAWLVLPFTLLVALSRMVLGLHYPSDVLAGGAIGVIVSGLSLAILP
ncbi:MAG: phosphatase PAP2 family protein [Burkholderiales bacterium]